MLNHLKRFVKDESGAAAIEYGLITSGISVAIIPGVKDVGSQAGRRSSPSCKTRCKRRLSAPDPIRGRCLRQEAYAASFASRGASATISLNGR